MLSLCVNVNRKSGLLLNVNRKLRFMSDK